MSAQYENIIKPIKEFMNGRFDLSSDGASQEEVEERLENGVVIRGINLWVLIFATFIASIGLNMNSLAVIIGAMLISPLMGPIMGMGFGLGMHDFNLFKRAIKNFGFMVLISILTSTIYFTISPLTVVQSEMLSRTQPTTFDVLVAFIGGLAGVVAQTRQDRISTVVPGVAIATALMPPLCTAGYGLATGELSYFLGAFYLFIINTVFIAISSFVVVGFLKYKKKEILDPRREKKVKATIATIIFLTIVPSVFIGYKLVRTTIFEYNVTSFVKTSFNFDNTNVVSYTQKYHGAEDGRNKIEVVLWGEPISNDAIDALKLQMPNYGITNCQLVIKQNKQDANFSSELVQTNYEMLLEKNNEINRLQSELREFKSDILPSATISKELNALLGVEMEVMLNKDVVYNNKGGEVRQMLFCYISSVEKLTNEEIDKLKDWLSVRTSVKDVRIVTERLIIEEPVLVPADKVEK